MMFDTIAQLILKIYSTLLLPHSRVEESHFIVPVSTGIVTRNRFLLF
jgi:hypothetical protein